jgi:hypothetical protein
MAGVFNTTPAMMAVVHDEAKDECEKNKGEFSVHNDLQIKLSSFLVAPWITSADNVFRTKITVVIVRQKVNLYSLITVIYTCMKGWRRCLFKEDRDH